MNVLLLGSGGREHALAWKINQSPLLSRLFIAPGNAGTESYGSNVDLALTDFDALKRFCLDKKIDMLVVGPEGPLVDGIFDYFEKEKLLNKVLVIGPSKTGALLEGSKDFAKEFMNKYGIPTASYRTFRKGELEAGLEYLKQHPTPIVLKADGLAAGKGVLICENREEAVREFEEMLSGKFGTASEKVVVESFLKGREFSVFVLTDGEGYQVLPVAKDYKRIGEGDSGLNTGGMGSVSPVSFVSDALMKRVENEVIKPTINGIKSESINYKGFVFFGMIEVEGDPFVIEYNCRMGDPETQVVLPRLKNDILELFVNLHRQKLGQSKIVIEEEAAAAIILVSGGYPGAYEKGKRIEGIDAVSGSMLFHAGTKKEENEIKTNGGRVIAVTSRALNFKDAIEISNKNAERIVFDDKYYRKDIGFDL